MNHRKRIVYGIVVTLLLSYFAFMPFSFAQEPIPSIAPINPAFLQYLSDLKTGKISAQTVDGHSLGYIPSPLLIPQIDDLISTQAVKIEDLPTSYDLRPNRVTSVKDQLLCGACWAFASYGSLESFLKPEETWDFSENNLKNTHGFDFGHCIGGNKDMATAYLARWSGPINETDDPYNPSSSTSPSGKPVQKHVQEVLYLPTLPSSEYLTLADLETIKNAVTNYGAVYTSFYVDDSYYANYYNNTTHAYYYNGTNGGNHAVAIVGWNDNYSISNFKQSPRGNGAFIAKNSWGTSWGESGYFYISYYDSKMGKAGEENAVFINAEPTTNYTTVYQYDPLGWVISYGYGSDSAWGANIFTATSSEALNAVSFYTASLNSDYQLYIYTGVTAGQPTSGSLATSKAGTIPQVGYHTISLDSTVILPPGQRFSVVVRFTTSGFNYPVPAEIPWSGYSSGATAHVGESYLSSNGINWSDITSYDANTNVCIKAFTVRSLVSFSEGFESGWTNWAQTIAKASGYSDPRVTREYTTSNVVEGSYKGHFRTQPATSSPSWHVVKQTYYANITKGDTLKFSVYPLSSETSGSYRRMYVMVEAYDGSNIKLSTIKYFVRDNGSWGAPTVWNANNIDLRSTCADNAWTNITRNLNTDFTNTGATWANVSYFNVYIVYELGDQLSGVGANWDAMKMENSPPPTPDFTITATPSSRGTTVGIASSVTYTVTVAALNGFTGEVALGVTGHPNANGETPPTFVPPAVAGSGSSTLTVYTTETTPASTYALTITGTSGALAHSVSSAPTLVVSPPAPPFSEGFESGWTNWTQTISKASGYNDPRVTREYTTGNIVEGSYKGHLRTQPATSSPSWHVVRQRYTNNIPKGDTFKFSVYPISSEASGPYRRMYIMVEAYDGSNTKLSTIKYFVRDNGSWGTPTVWNANNIDLRSMCVDNAWTNITRNLNTDFTNAGAAWANVSYFNVYIVYELGDGTSGVGANWDAMKMENSPPPTPDFTITATPSSRGATVGTPSSVTYTVTVAALNGFTGEVALGVTGHPNANGETPPTFVPSAIISSGSSTLTVYTSATTLASTYTLAITGTSSALSHSASPAPTLIVSPPGPLFSEGFETGWTNWTQTIAKASGYNDPRVTREYTTGGSPPEGSYKGHFRTRPATSIPSWHIVTQAYNSNISKGDTLKFSVYPISSEASGSYRRMYVMVEAYDGSGTLLSSIKYFVRDNGTWQVPTVWNYNNIDLRASCPDNAWTNITRNLSTDFTNAGTTWTNVSYFKVYIIYELGDQSSGVGANWDAFSIT